MTHSHTRRRVVLAALAAGGAGLAACTTAEQEALLRSLTDIAQSGGAAGLTEGDAAQGIRAALNQGVSAAVAQVSADGGYLNDPRIHIPLPGVLGRAQSTLSPIGFSGMFDELEVQLNRAAEAAAPEARSIFVDAITALTIQDALEIVRGPDTAATEYLQGRTTPALTRLFTPPMEQAFAATGVTRTLNAIDARLAAVPLAPRLSDTTQNAVVAHAVGEGLDGLFYYVGQEEAAIRANPAKRTSDILRRVFG